MLLLVSLVMLVSAVLPSQNKFRNLKILPKDISEAELDKVKSIFTKPGIKKIHVTGFTDDAGTESYNKSLSEKRANEIARLLSLKFGIPAYRIEAEGKGISLDYADKKQNRRVEIYIYH